MKVSLIQILLIALLATCMVITLTEANSPGWLINRYIKESEDRADELADALIDAILLSDKVAHVVKPNNAGKYNADEIFYKKRTLSDKVAFEVKPNNAGKYNPDEIFYKKKTRALADDLIEHIYRTFDRRGRFERRTPKYLNGEMSDKVAYEIKPNNAGKYNPETS